MNDDRMRDARKRREARELVQQTQKASARDDRTTRSVQNTQGMRDIPAGTAVFDAAGEKIGMVREVNREEEYVLVQRGRFLAQDLYVPFGAIRKASPAGVSLRIYKAYLGNPQYAAPPTSAAPMTPTAASREADEVNLPLWEEQLVVEKQERELRRVHVRKYVIEEERTVSVPVEREEVRVEHVPVQGDIAPGPGAFQEEDIAVPVRGEAVLVHKHARVVDELRLRKERIVEQREITDTIRRERVALDGMTADDRAEDGGPIEPDAPTVADFPAHR